MHSSRSGYFGLARNEERKPGKAKTQEDYADKTISHQRVRLYADVMYTIYVEYDLPGAF